MALQTKGSADVERTVEIPCGSHTLAGILHIPVSARGIVAFAHGSGSGRLSPRNQFVAQTLQQAGIGTLLLDLLEEEEADDREKVFDIPLLADRLETAGNWLTEQHELASLRLGYFGASTGAAAALVAAAHQPEMVRAVVSRGGRPDLASDDLPAVKAPTLLIVGGDDDVVIGLNEQAAARLSCPHKLAIIPGATHLFPEPGALEEVSRLAAEWFRKHLASK